MNTAPEAKQPLQSFVPEPAPVAPAAGSLNRALPSPVLQQAAPLAAPAPAASTSGASARDAERTNTAPLREQRMVPPAQPAKPAPAPPPPAPAASEDRMAPAAIPSENRGLFIRNNETPAAAGAAAGKPAASSLDAQPLRKEKAASGERREAIDATQAAKPPRSPQDWIAEIRALRQAGREAEAQAALKQLKTAYPDFAIPDDLRDKP